MSSVAAAPTAVCAASTAAAAMVLVTELLTPSPTELVSCAIAATVLLRERHAASPLLHLLQHVHLLLLLLLLVQ